MQTPRNKTKLVCTIGPASDSPGVLAAMLQAGMDVARLNFSHGDFASHAATIARLREAARQTCPVPRSASVNSPARRSSWPTAAGSP